MTENRQPYAPPRSEVEDVEEIRARPITGVVVGAIVDLGGTILAAIVLAVAYTAYLAAQGAAPEQIEQTLATAPAGSAYFNIATAIGLFFSALGGYVCASYTREHVYRAGLVLAMLVCVIGFLIGGGQHSQLFDTIVVAVTFAAVMFGVWWYQRKQTFQVQ
jgi:hypothetical protein